MKHQKTANTNEEDQQKIFKPSLVYMLSAEERRKGKCLTEKEVEQICDQAIVMTAEISRIKEIEESRGYKDINPNNCWEEWLEFKRRMSDSMNKCYNIEDRISAHIEFKPSDYSFFAKLFKQNKVISTKFGGNPSLIKAEEWPVSAKLGKRMKFICQIVLDKGLFGNADGKIVYLFITDDEDIANTWDPAGGENAVIIKSIGDASPSKPENQDVGPIYNTEYIADLTYKEEPEFYNFDWNDDQYDEYFANVAGNKIGGKPYFLEKEVDDFQEGWRLLLQIDSTQTPFEIDFGGDGVGYIFINKDYTKGKFLWQCD